jgi:hypothetical protein
MERKFGDLDDKDRLEFCLISNSEYFLNTATISLKADSNIFDSDMT